jgi:hypothetical protein
MIAKAVAYAYARDKGAALAVQYLGVRSRLLRLFRALMVIGPPVTKHRLDDVWSIKV